MTDLLENVNSIEDQKNKLLDVRKSTSEGLTTSLRASNPDGIYVDTSTEAALSETFQNIRSPQCQVTIREYHLLKTF